MTAFREHRGVILFGLIAIIVLIGAYAAYQATGPMGIEERFNTAAGLSSGGEDEDGGIAGFFLEGNMLSYLLVLVILAVACFAVYRHNQG